MNKYLLHALKKNKHFKHHSKKNMEETTHVGNGINKASILWNIRNDLNGNAPHSQVKSTGTTATSVMVGGGIDKLDHAFAKLDFRQNKKKKPHF